VAEDSDLERTEPASSRRLEQAREEGRVPRSRELSAFLVLLAGVGAFWAMGGSFVQQSADILRRGLSFGHATAFDAHAMANTFLSLSTAALLVLAPVFLLTVIGAVAAPTVLGGLILSPKAFAPDFGRINPLSGLGRIFSMQGVGEMVKAILKALLVGGVVYWVVAHRYGDLFALAAVSVETGLAAFAQLLQFAAMALLGGVALVAAIDVPFQLWQYYSKLRMTREEVRQEGKEQEGDPQVKGRIRSQQREMARRRMMSEVPQANVVVTNPTHFAVALRYDSQKMGAPLVVAKGMNHVAQRIRELAAEHGVPQLEAPPLARALHRHCDIGEQIPAALYTAVAEVMAYVYQLDRYLSGEDQGMARPQTPHDLVIPEGMDPGVPEDGRDAGQGMSGMNGVVPA
jgi:flagellar biosynthetic protein FlhB